MSCRAVRGWLHRDTESLTEADRLVLEEHLGACERCRDEREQLSRVRRIGAALPAESIGPRGHQRAIARALMQGPVPTAAPERRLPWWTFAAGGALAAGVAAVTFVVFRSDGADSPSPNQYAAPSEHLSLPATTAAQNVASPRDVVELDVAVIAGTLTHEDTAVADDRDLPADVDLRAATDVQLRAYGVHVVVSANSQIRRSSVGHLLILERGRVELDGKGLRVATDGFIVETDGAAAISPRRVSVQHGKARIVTADGRQLASVAAGQSWEPAGPRSVKLSATALLEQARAAFTAGDHAAAERHADAALDASPSRAQAAEGRMIQAECAQASGRLDDALARYEAIATRFADLPAGETALFAAARLEAKRDHAVAARALLERYLDRYPSGRFADDARRQLRAPH